MAVYDTGKMILFVRNVMWDLGIPQESATVLYKDNDTCTTMGNAQKPTTCTRHMNVKYFSIYEWTNPDLMQLECIDTKVNMLDHLTKSLSCALFHRHANFLLGSVPPTYSPVHKSIVGAYMDSYVNIDEYIPDSFTTPICTKAAWSHALHKDDYIGNPWLIVLWHS